MCKHTDQFQRTQVDGIYREPIPTHQLSQQIYQPPQISICERYAASYYGGFESKRWRCTWRSACGKLPILRRSSLDAETVVLAVQQPTVLLLCWPLHAEKRAPVRAQKAPYQQQLHGFFAFQHKSGKNYEGRTYNGSHVYVYRTDASTMFD